jgi:hypothetical protein
MKSSLERTIFSVSTDEQTLGDADVVPDVKKKKLEIDPTSSEELETLKKLSPRIERSSIG